MSHKRKKEVSLTIEFTDEEYEELQQLAKENGFSSNSQYLSFLIEKICSDPDASSSNMQLLKEQYPHLFSFYNNPPDN